MESNSNLFDEETLQAIVSNRSVRQHITRESHLMFFHVYFSHYVKYAIAEFQKDIFRITEDQTNRLACIVAFRGSGKSTLVTFSYALWGILGVQQKKFVLLVCQTQAQARQHMANLKYELERNMLLRSDLGPFREDVGSDGQWAISSLVFQNTGARIMIASMDQSIRGIRHHEHRPDLIILDDIEDMNSTKTKEGRDKLFDWFTREILPLGDIGTRTIIVGNLVHEDALVMRVMKKMDAKEIEGTYRRFPLIDKEGKCLWPGKFDTPAKLETLRKSIVNDFAWKQEYLLEIVSDHTRVIHPEWIQSYDVLPIGRPNHVITGVDLAISQSSTADYTTMVTLVVYGYGSKLRAYVLPNPVNKRMTFPDTVQTAAALKAQILTSGHPSPKFYIESNGFQEIYVGAFANVGCTVKGVKQMNDKRSRLALTSDLVQKGVVLFPKDGIDDLYAQLTGFGKENHDDLSDAFATAVLQIIDIINKGRSFEAWQEWVQSNGGSCWI